MKGKKEARVFGIERRIERVRAFNDLNIIVLLYE